MPLSGTGERVTPVLDFPSRDGLSVQAIRVDYEPQRGRAGEPDRVLRARRRESATVYDRV
jgi:hypothetical protein